MPLFNVRVYGILKDSHNRVLVSDEFIRGNYFTKFWWRIRVWRRNKRVFGT
jgi:hypothetical protein